MRVERRNFLKLLGGGSAAAGATAYTRFASAAVIQPDITGPTAANGALPRLGEPKPPRLPRAETLEARMEFFPAAFDVVDAVHYDRFHFRPGQAIPTHWYFFQTPIGQWCPYTGIYKDPAFTSMWQCGRLPMPSNFWIKGLHIFVNPDSDPDAVRVLDRCSWQLMLGQKIYAQGSVMMDRFRGNTPALARIKQKAAEWGLVKPDGAAYSFLPPPPRRSMEFAGTKGLFVPMGLCFSVEFTNAGGSYLLKHDGFGLDVAFVMEGLEARGIS